MGIHHVGHWQDSPANAPLEDLTMSFTSATLSTSLHALDIGETAQRLLASDQRGTVLAAVSNALYLLSEQGELFWLATADVARHPRGIRISEPLPRLAVNTSFVVDGHGLIIGSDTVLDRSRASIWRAPRISADDVLPVTCLPERLYVAFSALDGLPSPAGLGSLLPEILHIATNEQACPRSQDLARVPALACPAIREIAHACMVHDGEKIMAQTESLIGLGEGLTPSGDDFAGGLLFCFYWLSRLYPNHLPPLVRTNSIERLSGRTNLISFTVLKDLANGQGVEPLHLWLDCVLAGRPVALIQQQAARLIRIGHSTGWDLLSGALTGLLLTLRLSA
ncbi:MAG: DUF2877 domain-containing protein [Anaerolineae bacterium]|nr:DUF2877 domain-containing protein [Anaerolineae bacterium]